MQDESAYLGLRSKRTRPTASLSATSFANSNAGSIQGSAEDSLDHAPALSGQASDIYDNALSDEPPTKRMRGGIAVDTFQFSHEDTDTETNVAAVPIDGEKIHVTSTTVPLEGLVAMPLPGNCDVMESKRESASRVCIVWSEEHELLMSLLRVNKDRLKVWSRLATAYGVFSRQRKCCNNYFIIKPKLATRDDLLEFHTEEYVNALLDNASATSTFKDVPISSPPSYSSPSPSSSSSSLEDVGLIDDAAPFPGLSQYVQSIAGAALTAADELRSGRCKVAISWEGGRHHAFESRAAGFCYVNDVVLSVMRLQSPSIPSTQSPTLSLTRPPSQCFPPFERILVIDTDAHHGDAVEAAFHGVSNTFTLSFHRYSPLFYPGTGDLVKLATPSRSGSVTSSSSSSTSSVPSNTPRYMFSSPVAAANVPLPPDVSDDVYIPLFKSVVREIIGTFIPDCIVYIVGGDALEDDPIGGMKISIHGLSECVADILGYDLPTLLFGGGGYNNTNCSKLWTVLTEYAINKVGQSRNSPIRATASIASTSHKGTIREEHTPNGEETDENGKTCCGEEWARLRDHDREEEVNPTNVNTEKALNATRESKCDNEEVAMERSMFSCLSLSCMLSKPPSGEGGSIVEQIGAGTNKDRERPPPFLKDQPLYACPCRSEVLCIRSHSIPPHSLYPLYSPSYTIRPPSWLKRINEAICEDEGLSILVKQFHRSLHQSQQRSDDVDALKKEMLAKVQSQGIRFVSGEHVKSAIRGLRNIYELTSPMVFNENSAFPSALCTLCQRDGEDGSDQIDSLDGVDIVYTTTSTSPHCQNGMAAPSSVCSVCSRKMTINKAVNDLVNNITTYYWRAIL